MNHIILAGTFSVGKSTTAKALKEKLPDFHHIPDQARVWLNENKLTSNELSTPQKRELQLDVMESYVQEESIAEKGKKCAIFDSSLVEVLAYSEGILNVREMNVLRKLLQLYKHNYTALIFPPTIPLDDDNLRHTDPEFRVKIHTDVVRTLQRFDIPHLYILSQSIEDRVKEVLSYIPNAHLLRK